MKCLIKVYGESDVAPPDGIAGRQTMHRRKKKRWEDNIK